MASGTTGIQQASAKPFLRVPPSRIHVAGECRDQRPGKQHVALPQHPPGLDIDLVRLLSVPGGDLPVPRPAFHLGEVAEELVPDDVSSQPFVLGQLLVEHLACGIQLARPQQLEAVTGPGRGEDGRLASRTLPHRQVLQLHGLGHEALRRPAQQELDHGEGGQRIGPDCGIGDQPHQIHGGARVLRGEGEIATVDPHPGKVLMDGSPGLGVIPHLLQGLLGESLDAAHVKPTDGRQAKVDAGAVTTRARHGDRLFQQRRRAGRVAGVEVVLGCRHAPSREPCALLGRRQLPGQLQQLGGRVRGSPGARVPACLLQRSCHMHVGAAGREGRCRARSSGSSTSSARRRCTLRLVWGVASA
jgi:hypothetical protein